MIDYFLEETDGWRNCQSFVLASKEQEEKTVMQQIMEELELAKSSGVPVLVPAYFCKPKNNAYEHLRVVFPNQNIGRTTTQSNPLLPSDSELSW